MSSQDSQPDMKLFWGCFIALITTAFAFITRAFLVNAEPSLAKYIWLGPSPSTRVLFGAGIWPFAISIIVFSLIIDNIGYRVSNDFQFRLLCSICLTRISSLWHCDRLRDLKVKN